jgi:UDP-N-acetylglucosamine 1-carboxyvinyltransferase
MPTGHTGTSSQWAKIGQRIALLREERHLTQQALAKLLGTSQSAIARMEKGEQNVTAEMLRKVSQALGREIVVLAGASMNFRIEGGHKLSGVVQTKTSKNAAVALLCAALLNQGRTRLKEMPRIQEVERIIEVLISLGVSVKWLPGNDLEIVPPRVIDIGAINEAAAVKTRSVLMLLGVLIHRFHQFSLPQPGGCKLGARTVRPHLYALEKFGVDIEAKRGTYLVTARNLRPAEVVLYEQGDTVTENALLAAACMAGKSVIKLASANYMVQDLCHYLEQLGVVIEGIGTTTLTVYGTSEINQDVTYAPSEDPIESMLFLSIAATTKSSLTIERCPIDFLELELLKMEKMGFRYKVLRRYKGANGCVNLADIKTYPSRLVALEEKLHALPGNVGINIDNLPFFVPMATQATGQTLIHDWTYENRAIYYCELSKLGADVILADPHRVFINGGVPLRGTEIICPPALRPAAIILIAMLAAEGTSILRNVYSISRGYEDLATRLRSLGAKIETLSDF